VFILVVNNAIQTAGVMTRVPTSGEVPGELLPGRRTWKGRFKPPAGSPGPWLLITEATDAAGIRQRDYLYIGGRYGTRPD
jgi:hypothetical protein